MSNCPIFSLCLPPNGTFQDFCPEQLKDPTVRMSPVTLVCSRTSETICIMYDELLLHCFLFDVQKYLQPGVSVRLVCACTHLPGVEEESALLKKKNVLHRRCTYCR